MLTRRRLLAASVGGLALSGTGVPRRAIAQIIKKQVRIIVPFPPGGGTDVVARSIAQKLGASFGQQFIVDNRGGAAGNLGAELAARAAPDGYTLLLVSGTQAANATLFKSLAYDLVRDFAAVSQLAAAPLLLVVHPSLPVKSPAELIALAKARPQQLNYASGGAGTAPHMAMELFKISTGITMTHVPYKGNGPAVAELLGGQCQLMFANITGVLTQAKAGRLRALAVSSLDRSPLVPDVPTMAEAGVAGYDVVQWFGLTAPAGTPSRVIVQLHAAVARIQDTQEFRDLLTNEGARGV
jgi:tripartite-type tricarboxylate transporter receptor subunit TctC